LTASLAFSTFEVVYAAVSLPLTIPNAAYHKKAATAAFLLLPKRLPEQTRSC
jgi:hypothetical protein